MGDASGGQGSRAAAWRVVAGLFMVVAAFAVAVAFAPASRWWDVVWALLLICGLELSVLPRIRAWGKRNRARIAERDAALRSEAGRTER